MERTVNDKYVCASSRDAWDVEEVDMILGKSHDWDIARGVWYLPNINPTQGGAVSSFE
jgi:hypothetical protein